MNDLIVKIADLTNELYDISTQHNDYFVSVNSIGPSVHIVDNETFFGHFPQPDFEKLDDQDTPYKATAEVDGIEFMTLIWKDEVEKYVPKMEV